ncbi:hypothetical protein [Glaciecola sp. SC05]|uniref:hypothetical protein n=1 Tax=Glaciecola sp. SC05 TaxID=1987355 RepID=UPI003528D7F8
MTYKSSTHSIIPISTIFTKRCVDAKSLRNLSALIVLVLSLSLGGCANIGSLFGTQGKPTEAESAVNENNEAQESLAAVPAELSPAEIAELAQAKAEALAAEQSRQARLALINSPNRFSQSKRANQGAIKALLESALAAYKNNEFVQAQRFIEQAKADPSPLNSGAYVLAGDIYLAQAQQAFDSKDSKRALKEQFHINVSLAKQSYENALSLNPHNYKAANRRALLHREDGEFDQALRLYGRAIEAYPGHAPSYRNRGILHDLYMGNKAAALEDYNTYSALLEFQKAYQAKDLATEDLMLAPDMISEFLAPDLLKRELRRVNGWQLDLERQLKAAGIDTAKQVFKSKRDINSPLIASSSLEQVVLQGNRYEY